MNAIPNYRIDSISKCLADIVINNYTEPVTLDSTLIEGILLRYHLPPLYLDIENNLLLKHKVITNFYLFKQDKNKLQGLKYFKDLEDLTYSQINREYQRRVEETEILVIRLEYFADEYILEQVKNFWDPNYD